MSKHRLIQLYADHSGKISDKWLRYLVEYERLFREQKNRPIRLLEIGVQNGGSLEIWSKYFRNAEKLVGCDINPACEQLIYNDSRIEVIVGDINTCDVHTRISSSGPFDIIIDDGSHCSSDIIKSFFLYFPLLTVGGVFVVEDMHCSYWQEFEGGLSDPHSSMAFFKHITDILNHEHWQGNEPHTEHLESFFLKYDFHMAEEDLQEISSIEFINSMCVLRKARADCNMLGLRIIAGNEAIVDTGSLDLRTCNGEAECQTIHAWIQSCEIHKEEYSSHQEDKANYETQVADHSLKHAECEEKLAQYAQTLAEKDALISSIFQSTSWRLTSPLRGIGHPIRRAQFFLNSSTRLIKHAGGWGAVARRVAELSRKKDFAGIERGIKRLASAGRISPSKESDSYDRNNYAEWVRRYDTINDAIRASMSQRISGFDRKPCISVVMPTYNPKPEWLSEAIESVRKQIYPYWELCIADDASTDPAIRSLLEAYARRDARIKVVFRDQNGHISAASNSALELVTGDWVALLDHDDLLTEHALFWVAETINRDPDVRLIYSDEDKIDNEGKRSAPYFKCDWNLDLFYSHNMICHLGAYRTDLVREVGGFRVGLEGAQDYDLALRCVEQIPSAQIRHIPRVLYHWRIHAGSTANSGSAKPYAMLAGERALNEYFQRRFPQTRAESMAHGYRVHYNLPATPPLVSLIIPTRNGVHLLRQCIESVLEKTSYPNFEILIVDNGSNDPATLQYLETLTLLQRVRILRDDRPFNYSALNNSAIKVARGEVIGLLNNDIEVISPDWLSEMVSHAIQEEVGAVGAKLLYPNKTLQHGGVILGIKGVAGHAHKHLSCQLHGYFCRASLTQALSAVTAACLIIRKCVYEEVGGLNETDLQVAFNDVDFCLRVREAGYRNVWTPFAELYHHESATRGFENSAEKQARFAREVSYMQARWADWLHNDPAYSPNLTLDHEDFSLAWPPRNELI